MKLQDFSNQDKTNTTSPEPFPKRKGSVSDAFAFMKRNQVAVLTAIIGFLLLIVVILGALLWLRPMSSKHTTEQLQKEILEYSESEKEDHSTSDTDTKKQEPDRPIIVSPKTSDDVDAPSDKTDIDTALVDFSEEELKRNLPEENDPSYDKAYILAELYPFYESGQEAAIYDLVKLRRYRKLSYTLKGTNEYYYMGDTGTDGLPNGKGLAIYADNTYYFGSFQGGKRNGNGIWQRFYLYGTEADSQHGKYTSHSYIGMFQDGIPNGDGQEHFDTDISAFEAGEEKYQNIIGHFTNGLYDGEMYLNTIDYTGNVREWNGKSHLGSMQLFEDMSSKGECAVWSDLQEPDHYIYILERENHSLGFREFIK